MPDITTQSGYMERFWELVSENRLSKSPMRNALILLESELYAQYGLRRYTTYVSFSVVKTRKPQMAKCRVI